MRYSGAYDHDRMDEGKAVLHRGSIRVADIMGVSMLDEGKPT